MAESSARNASAKARTSNKEELEAEVTKLRADLSSIGETLETIASDEAHAFSASVRSKLDEAARVARDTGDKVRARAEFNKLLLEDQIRQNPFVALLIAIGLGFLVGAILRRR